MLDEKDMSAVLCDQLLEMGEKDDRLVLVAADSLTVTGVDRFREKFPDRVLNVGIAEANMVGVAAGLANCGKVPVVSTFSPFATRRCLDQVVISASYSKLSLKIIGLSPGITTEINGGTHMTMEDVGIMRTIPGITIVEPVDATQFAKMLPAVLDKPGVDYIRLFKGRATRIYDDSAKFLLGRGNVLTEGNDVSIFSSGIMLQYVLEAADRLREQGIGASVINIHTIKPLDEELVVTYARKTGAVMTVENHSIIGGLGSAVAECLSETCPVRMKRMGCRDHYGEVGKMPYLLQKFGLTVPDIVREAQLLMN